MTIENKIDDILNLVQDKEPAITKTEMQELVSEATAQKEQATYRQVSEKPVVVDIMDISDAAAKKLATIMSNTTEPIVEQTDDEKKPTSIVGKLLGFAKDIFIKILKVIGQAVGWVVGTLTGLLSQLSGWILKKIEQAMAISVAKSMGGMGGRFGKLGFLRNAAAITGAAAAITGGYQIMQGFDKVDSQLANINNQAQGLFSNPESMISSGMTSMPTFSMLGGSPPAESGEMDMSATPEDTENQEQSVDESTLEQQPITLQDINTELDIPDVEAPESVDKSPPVENVETESSADNIETVEPQQSGSTQVSNQLENINMFNGAEQIKPGENIGKTMAGLDQAIQAMDQNVNMSVNTASQSPGQVNTPNTPATSSIGIKPDTSVSASMSVQPTSMSPSMDITSTDQVVDTPVQNDTITSVSNLNMNAAGDAIAPLLTALQQAPENFESGLNSGMNASANLAASITTPAAESLGSSVSSQNIQMKSSPPAAASTPVNTIDNTSPRAVLTQPVDQQLLSMNTPDAMIDLQDNSDKTTQVLSELKDSISKKQTNIVNNTSTQNVSTTDFITNTDTLRKRTRNTSLTS